MATQAILTYRDGMLDVPAEVRDHFHLTEGSKLRVTLAPDSVGTLKPETVRAEPKRDWRSFRGFLKDYPPTDIAAMRAEERAWELAHDRRKYGLTGQ